MCMCVQSCECGGGVCACMMMSTSQYELGVRKSNIRCT